MNLEEMILNQKARPALEKPGRSASELLFEKMK